MAETIIPVMLFCPECGKQHFDEGEWEERAHRTHLCLHCGVEWKVTVRGATFYDAVEALREAAGEDYNV